MREKGRKSGKRDFSHLKKRVSGDVLESFNYILYNNKMEQILIKCVYIKGTFYTFIIGPGQWFDVFPLQYNFSYRVHP